MGANKINLKKTFCPVWTYKISAGENKAKAKIVYLDDYDGWGGRAPDLNSEHPDIAGMRLVDLESSREEGLQVRVTLDYETREFEANYPGRPAGDPVKRYDFEIPTNEEHILSHQRYADLEDDERIALLNLSNGQEVKPEELGGGKWDADVTSELGLAALAKIRKGMVAYLSPGFIWIERFTTKDLSEIEIGKTAEIMEPPGPAPSAGEDRDWLYLGATGRNSEDGENWDVERRWQLSPKGGWDEIYEPGGEE